MAEEQEGKGAQQAGKAKGGLSKFIVLGVVVVGFAIAGLLTYQFVIRPMLVPPGEGQTEGEEQIPEEDLIPEGTVALDFDEARSDVIPEEGSERSSILLYKVSFVCANPETVAVIDANKQWFVSMLAEVHRGRTRTDLMDARVKASIADQALREANALLRRLQKTPDPSIRVIKVLHLNFSVYDL